MIPPALAPILALSPLAWSPQEAAPPVLPSNAALIEGHVHPVLDLVRVSADIRGLVELRTLDLDVVRIDAQSGQALVLVDALELEQLDDLQFDVEVVVPDLAAAYARRLAEGAPVGSVQAAGSNIGQWLSPPFGQGSMGGYYTFAEIESVLDQFRATYPQLISQKASIGTSLQGRPISMVRISDNPDVDEDEPEVRIDSLHHAREPQSMQATIFFVSWLLEEYGSDPLATYLVNEREIYVVPCVNPDGYEYNRSIAPGGGGLWRKNRRNNGDGTFGVDLNRNYPFQWGGSGSSGNTSSDIYRGTSPASEPETQAMIQFMTGRSFQTALTVHTFADLWLAPWGYVASLPPDWDEINEIGTLAVEESGYPQGPAAILLYTASGITTDYDYGTLGTYSWTPEIGGDTDGFWPPQSRIIPLAVEN
ncbi:MAG: M14 family metallopeptidase, partial [Planctomycetota bacterium]